MKHPAEYANAIPPYELGLVVILNHFYNASGNNKEESNNYATSVVIMTATKLNCDRKQDIN